jgi:hypothetical protein
MADTFTARGLRVERRHDRWNGTSYLAWKPDVSMLFTDTKELLAFVAWPRKTPTGDALREWLNASAPKAEPPPKPTAEQEIIDYYAILAAQNPGKCVFHPAMESSGFGPDPDDPNYETKTII